MPFDLVTEGLQHSRHPDIWLPGREVLEIAHVLVYLKEFESVVGGCFFEK